MASKIEQLIDEMEAYIDECKWVTFSQTNISVNKEIFMSMLSDLRMTTPDEIKQYQKIVSQREYILAETKKNAEAEAQEIIAKAHDFSDSIINEQAIVQQAYEQAQDIIAQATAQAQQILDQAQVDANGYKMSVMDYTDDSLANIESILSTAIETTQARHDSLINSLQQHLQTIVSDRAQLRPQPEAEAAVNGDGEQKIESVDIVTTDIG